MRLSESLRVAVASLAANKLRSSLTMLGIIIGVAAVVALMSIGQGAQQQIQRQVQTIGSNLVTVVPGQTQQGGVRSQAGQAQSLSLEDADALARAGTLPSALAVSPERTGFAQVVSGSKNTNTQVVGAVPAYLDVHSTDVATGEFVSTSQINAASPVVVLGATVAQQLFEDADPLGKTLKINRLAFRVIGVMAAKGGSGFGNADDTVFVPLTTAQAKLFGGRNATTGAGQPVSRIALKAVDEAHVDALIQEASEVLRARHKIVGTNDDFQILNQQDVLGALTQITTVMTLFLGSIAGISLLVGGIGIMNIMLVSVTERTREIGIRKAIGANPQAILLQFLIEAVTISVLGGLIGLSLGAGISKAVDVVFVSTAVSVWSMALAVGFSLAIGLFFGIYPARRASLLNPIDALRYE